MDGSGKTTGGTRNWVRSLISPFSMTVTYRQDRDGKWWCFNAQKGWLRADTAGRAFREDMADDLRRRLSVRAVSA